MNTFTLHTPESAPAGSRGNLPAGKGRSALFQISDAHLAAAAAAREAYFDLSASFDKTAFSNAEKQVILLTASVESGCEFCLAAHPMIARKMRRVPDAVVDARRTGEPIEPRPRALALALALASFTRSTVGQRGRVAAAPLQASGRQVQPAAGAGRGTGRHQKSAR